jgi:hypothetical protein
MPPIIDIFFNLRTQQISSLWLDRQEIIVSGIPLAVENFMIRDPTLTANIVITPALRDPPEPRYITLADSTKIKEDPSQWWFLGSLHMYKDRKRWELRNTSSHVRFPGETEFIRYRWIAFRPHWGEFIEGELFE